MIVEDKENDPPLERSRTKDYQDSLKLSYLIELCESARDNKEDNGIKIPFKNFFVSYEATTKVPTPAERIPGLCEDYKELNNYLDRQAMMRSGELLASLKNVHDKEKIKSQIIEVLEDNITEETVEKLENARYK